MTNEDAFYIQQALGELEFPLIFEKALQFALFRTYGIPSISKLLVQTSQFSDAATATRRYADTSVLITEFALNPPESERTHEAIARMNYIHSCYQKTGKICDNDMLYTLALFAVEPYTWVSRYEWRELEGFEKCAIGTFWKSIGDSMGIKYGKLRGGGEGGEGWTDGLHWLDEVAEWSQEYEREFMVPAETNQKTAEQTVAILLWSLPEFLKPYGKKVVSVLMDDRLRAAMMYAYSRTVGHYERGLLTSYLSGMKSRPGSTSPSSLPSSPSANTSFATFFCRAHTSYGCTISPTNPQKTAHITWKPGKPSHGI